MEAYPLCWPEGWPRTPGHKRERSQFKQTPDRARRALLEEIRRLIGRRYRRDDVIISTNVRLRIDGEPYAGQRQPEDAGVAVYFKYKDKPMVFACDRWSLVHDNIHSIAKTIDALRGIERWGASDMLERAFTGFQALPGPDHVVARSWRDVLDYYGSNLAEANDAYKRKRKDAHPDHGGTDELFYEINQAWAQAEQELRA